MIELPPKPSKPIPLHIFGGLHGAGKTSYIQHLIDHNWLGEKLGVILCEEGQVKLDFSRTAPARIERLLNACVCCDMAYAFFDVILQFLREGAIERIVVEISAQADIHQIFDVIRGSHLRDYLCMEPIHVLVDARHPHMKRDSHAPLIRRMLDQADVYVMSFHDAAEARNFDAGSKKKLLGPLPLLQ